MNKEEIFKKVLDSAFKVHTALGPGLLEKAYEECLFYELISCGIFAEKQKAMPVITSYSIHYTKLYEFNDYLYSNYNEDGDEV